MPPAFDWINHKSSLVCLITKPALEQGKTGLGRPGQVKWLCGGLVWGRDQCFWVERAPVTQAELRFVSAQANFREGGGVPECQFGNVVTLRLLCLITPGQCRASVGAS